MKNTPFTPNPTNPDPPLRSCINIDIHIEPVRHKTRAYKNFIKEFREALVPHKWQKFIGEVHVSWLLFQDEQTRAETDKMADLDNMVNGLNDAIKGPDGLLIDDSQIQSLKVTWLPREFDHEPHIRLRIEDPFILAVREPVRIYEMSDKRFYPLHAYDIGSRQEKLILNAFDSSISMTHNLADKLLDNPEDQKERFAFRQKFGAISQGFMKTRVADSGFEVVPYEDWRPRIAPDPRHTFDTES